MSGTIPTAVVRAAVDAVGLLKSRGLIGALELDQETAPGVTPSVAPPPKSNVHSWYVRRGMAGSHYWHISSYTRERIAVAHTEDDARLIASSPELLAALRELQANPNDPRAHRTALDTIAKATGGVK